MSSMGTWFNSHEHKYILILGQANEWQGIPGITKSKT
jgi:hypothetical protein